MLDQVEYHVCALRHVVSVYVDGNGFNNLTIRSSGICRKRMDFMYLKIYTYIGIFNMHLEMAKGSLISAMLLRVRVVCTRQ